MTQKLIQKSQALMRDILAIPYSIYFACPFYACTSDMIESHA